jgi:hypothetical protein
LGFLIIAPEICALRLFLEFDGLIAQAVDIKDTPEVYPNAISIRRHR